MVENAVPEYLDLLDAQREAVFAALDSLREEQIWQRPVPEEWCIQEKPVRLAELKTEVEATHSQIRAVYTGKDPDVLGNIHAYDPAIGVVNLITGLKVCIDHDQLHYDDVAELAASMQPGE